MMINNERKALELAGMLRSDLTSLERPVPNGGWYAPTVVHLDKTANWIIWGDLPKHPRPWMQERRPGPRMLEDFIRLSEATAERFLEYAGQWGVLMHCEHGLSYGLVRDPGCNKCQIAFTKLIEQGSPLLQEPVALWRQYAREMKSILNLAAALHKEEKTNMEDWRVILSRYPDDYYLKKMSKPQSQSLVNQQSHLASVIRDWALHADVQILFNWNPYQSPSITLGGNLLAALVIQLMCAVRRIDGLAICSYCGQPFLPTNRRSRYCPNCGIHAAWQKASQKYRTTIHYKKNLKTKKEYSKLYYRLVTRGGMTLENFKREWQKEKEIRAAYKGRGNSVISI